jgi:tripartite-type tricarboxylate transporter receptor subunit TctC
MAQQEYPSRPIDIVTHASPGGGTDTTARTLLIGTRLALNVDMAIVPKTGGGGVVAMNYVNQQPRDGYTVMGITPTHLFAIARGQGPLTIEDLVPVVRAADDPIIVTVPSPSQIKTLADLIELGQKRSIKWGTTQIGGIDHVAGAMLARAADTQLSVVPFGGGGEIVTNLMGANIDAAGLNLTEALDRIERGDFRALAVMSEQRHKVIDAVPTTLELGYNVIFSTVRGYVVLKGTPEERVRVLEKGMLEGLRNPTYQNYLKAVGIDPVSVAGSEVWAAQLARLYRDAREAMIELGIVKN